MAKKHKTTSCFKATPASTRMAVRRPGRLCQDLQLQPGRGGAPTELLFQAFGSIQDLNLNEGRPGIVEWNSRAKNHTILTQVLEKLAGLIGQFHTEQRDIDQVVRGQTAIFAPKGR